MGAISGLGALPHPANAQALPEAIQACRKEADDARRLQCFDRETARYPLTSEQSFGLTPSQVDALQKKAAPGAAPPREPEEDGPPASTGQLTATVSSLGLRPHAGFVVTLDNGQVWRQNEAEVNFDIRVGDQITIKPAKMGGYWLVGRTGRSTRVRRMK
ncbi:MAG: hypothetical protein U1F30_16280 [Steroidobacteraceae bacterium]